MSCLLPSSIRGSWNGMTSFGPLGLLPLRQRSWWIIPSTTKYFFRVAATICGAPICAGGFFGLPFTCFLHIKSDATPLRVKMRRCTATHLGHQQNLSETDAGVTVVWIVLSQTVETPAQWAGRRAAFYAANQRTDGAFHRWIFPIHRPVSNLRMSQLYPLSDPLSASPVYSYPHRLRILVCWIMLFGGQLRPCYGIIRGPAAFWLT